MANAQTNDIESAECAADISGDGSVAVEDLLALLASFGSMCITDSCDATCDDPINLDQLDGVSATGSDNMNDRGNPNTVIDMDHTPGMWTSSPTADFGTCAEQAYMTIDLGAAHTVRQTQTPRARGSQPKAVAQRPTLRPNHLANDV